MSLSTMVLLMFFADSSPTVNDIKRHFIVQQAETYLEIEISKKILYTG